MSGDVRLIDRLAPVLGEIERLERQKLQLRAELEVLCGSAGLTEGEIAEVYWLEDTVPSKFLGQPHEVLKMAQRHPYWSWACDSCGMETFVSSRSEKRRREAPDSDGYSPDGTVTRV